MQKSDRPLSPACQAASRSRGRPRAFDRDTALAQATQLFWIKGYEATSIADLTEAMGIGAPSLYAAFGSKEALYIEALGHYREQYEAQVWGNFLTAPTARGAVEALLMDSAVSLTGCIGDSPNGCMVTLSSIGSAEHSDIADTLRTSRAMTLDRLKARFDRAAVAGEIPASVDIHALARFVQAIQSGMSILSRDGATREELEGVAENAMLGWDARMSA